MDADNHNIVFKNNYTILVRFQHIIIVNLFMPFKWLTAAFRGSIYKSL